MGIPVSEGGDKSSGAEDDDDEDNVKSKNTALFAQPHEIHEQASKMAADNNKPNPIVKQ